MKRILLALLITVLSAFPLLAQTKSEAKTSKCTLGLDHAPELRGFRLGTPLRSVLSRFPGATADKPDNFGIAQLRFTVTNTTGSLKGARAVQPDINSAPGEETGFIIDSARFPDFKGVRRIQLRFIDGRLSFIQMAYDDSIKWEGVDEFVQTVAQSLNLSGTWNLPDDSDGSGRERELRCDGFALVGSVGGDAMDTHIAAQLSLRDLTASQMVEKRQQDLKDKAKREEDAKRKNFKP